MNVEKVTLKGVPVAVVEVHPSDMPPVRLRGQVWIRVGPRRAIATRQEERVLDRASMWRARAPLTTVRVLDATLDDLLVESFRSEYLPRVVEAGVIAQNNRSVEEQLASLRFFDLRRQTPTYAGVLVFGKDPLNFMPGAFIQFVRFDGMTLADSVQDEKPISGNLLTQLLQIDNLLPLQIRTARVSAGGLRHEEVARLPFGSRPRTHLECRHAPSVRSHQCSSPH